MNGLEEAAGNGCGGCLTLHEQLDEARRQVQRLESQLREAVRRREQALSWHQDQLLRNYRLRDMLHAAQQALRQEKRLRVHAEQRLVELEDRLRLNASNSSLAPSANPLHAPKPVKKKPTGRKIGAQKGHKGHGRKLLDARFVNEVVVHAPTICEHCQAPLADGLETKVLNRHQTLELPKQAVHVTEHQAHACRCGQCGRMNQGQIPREIKGHVLGERLAATIGFLSSQLHVTKRGIEQLFKEVLGVRLSLGSISAYEKEMAQALEGPYTQIEQEVRAAKVKCVDETGWKGPALWLWQACTQDTALFLLDRSRGKGAFKKLLGQEPEGVISTDRYRVYMLVPPKRRGICWSHLKRDFQRWLERPGIVKRLGQEGGAITTGVFEVWGQFKDGKLDRAGLMRAIGPLRKRMKTLLEWGIGCGVKKARNFCLDLLKLEEAMWNFAHIEGLEPTNNFAERMLRPAVIWRSISQGTRSQSGCRFVERALSVIHTLKLREAPVIDFLQETIKALRQGRAPPALAA